MLKSLTVGLLPLWFLTHPPEKALGLEWLADMKPLSALAIQLEKPIVGTLIFDSFCDNLEIHAVREVYYRAHDRRSLLATFEPRHEGSVDLELAEGQAVKVIQRGHAGTEVIDRKADSLDPETVEYVHVSCRVSHGSGLRDLHDQPAAIESVGIEAPGDPIREIELGQGSW